MHLPMKLHRSAITLAPLIGCFSTERLNSTEKREYLSHFNKEQIVITRGLVQNIGRVYAVFITYQKCSEK